MGRKEDKQKICDAICIALKTTSNAGGSGNPLEELKYIKANNGMEYVRPIFQDGTGIDGYYDVNVTCDSGTAMFIDIARQFVAKMW